MPFDAVFQLRRPRSCFRCGKTFHEFKSLGRRLCLHHPEPYDPIEGVYPSCGSRRPALGNAPVRSVYGCTPCDHHEARLRHYPKTSLDGDVIEIDEQLAKAWAHLRATTLGVDPDGRALFGTDTLQIQRYPRLPPRAAVAIPRGTVLLDAQPQVDMGAASLPIGA